MGDYAAAEPLYHQAVGIWNKVLGEEHPHYALSVNSLALLYDGMGEYAQAEPLCRQAMEGELRFAHRMLSWLPESRALAACDTLQGCDLLLSVLRKRPGARPSETYDAVWRTRRLVVRTLAERRQRVGDSPQATECYAQLRRVGRQLAQLSLAVPQSNGREARRKRLAELNEEKERLERELASLSQEYRQALKIRDAQIGDLVQLLPPEAAMVDVVHTRVWSPPQSGKGEFVVEQHYEAFVLRPIKEDPGYTVAWVHLGPVEPIDEAISQWRATVRPGRRGLVPLDEDAVEEEPEEAGSPVGRLLRVLLWDKIEPHLDGCSRVVIIPDGSLHFLPWAALPGKRPGTYLIEDYAIATASYGQQLYGLLREEPSLPSGDLLALGGADYNQRLAQGPPPEERPASTENGTRARTREPAMTDRPHWAYLDGSREEVESVSGLWQASDRATVLSGTDAGEDQLRHDMPQARYIHLATHGFFADEEFRSAFGHDVAGEQLFGRPQLLGFGQDDRLLTAHRGGVTSRNPLILSGVVLAGANLPPKTDGLGLPTGEDGILTAEEIVYLDLRDTELVVLSACETGLGRVAGGEGVMGLQRAFHLAGARAVVASLWKVDDNATKALMVEFYKNLWQKKMGKLEALRQAQLAMIRSYDPETGQLRGPGAIQPVDPDRLAAAPDAAADQDQPLPPFYWAAFQLSGDWR